MRLWVYYVMFMRRAFVWLSAFYFVMEVLTISTKENLINEEIKLPEVRVVGNDGEMLGVFKIAKALELAAEKDLDLVLLSPGAVPPVCKIMDYGKFCFEKEKRAKEAKKKQHIVDIKEVKVRYKIDTHDYEVRLKNIRKFISQGNKVKIVVMLRGREMQHSQLAIELANRFLKDLENDPVVVDKQPVVEGRNVTAWLSPQS